MAAIKSFCLVYFVLLCSGFCHGGRLLSEDAQSGSDNHAGTGMMNGDRSSGEASADDFRFRGIIGGWDGIPSIEVPAFDIPVIGIPGFEIPAFGIPSFGIGGGIDIDFGGSVDPELGRNGGGVTMPRDGGSHDDPKLLPDNPVDGGAPKPGDEGSHDVPKLLPYNPVDGGAPKPGDEVSHDVPKLLPYNPTDGGATNPSDGGSHDIPIPLPDKPVDGGAPKPGDEGSHDDQGSHNDPKLRPFNNIDGGDSPIAGRKNGYAVDDHEAWKNKKKMQEMTGNAMAPKDSMSD